MKNLRKLLAVVVVVAMMATFMIPAFAEESTLSDAEICETLGILKGTGDGVTEEYLASATERNQAAIMFLRLQNLEDEALAYDGEDNFDDADELWSGGQAVLAYLKANPDLGWQGVGDNKFEPRVNIDAKSYYKVMLEALGYKQDVDFEWGEVLEFAAEKGLSAIADVEELTNADIATATVEALKATVKDSELTLIEKLIADGVVSEDAAVEAGLVSGALTASVAATGAKKITVTFNKAADDTKATFTVKKGSFAVNVKEVTFAADKKSAVLELATKLTEGTYTVTVGGLDEELTGSFTVEDEKVAKIEITSSKASLDRGNAKKIYAYYKVYNQYSEDITDTYSGLTPTAGKGVASVSAGKITIDNSITGGSGTDFAVDEKVALSIIDASSGTFASTVLEVSDKAQVADIAITKLVNNVDEDNQILDAGDTNPEEFKLVIEAKDQYGNAITSATVVKEDVIVTVSNNLYVDVAGGASNPTFVDTVDIDDDSDTTDVTLALANGSQGNLRAGTSKVSIISKFTGKMASFDVVVKEAKKVDTLSLSAPSVAVAGDEEIVIPFTAIDQDGNAVVKAADLTVGANGAISSITATDGSFTTAGSGFVTDYKTGNAKLVYDASLVSAETTVVITAVTGTNKVVQLSFKLLDPAEPTVVTGINADSDFAKVLAKGATSVMDYEAIVIHDQYGREYDIGSELGTSTDQYRILVQTGTASKVSLAGGTTVTAGSVYAIDDGTDKITFSGDAKGTSAITVKLQKNDSDWKDVANSAYTFTAKVVEKADIASYEIGDFPKLYENGDSGVANAYATGLKVFGVLSNGEKVALPLTGYYSVTSGDAKLIYNTSTGELKHDSTYTGWGTDTERTVPIVVTVDGADGAVVLTKNIIVSKDIPKPETLALQKEGTVGTGIGNAKKESDGVVSVDLAYGKVDEANVKNFAEDIVEIKDQYGKVLTTSFTMVVVTNLPKDKTLGGSGVNALEVGDSYNVTAITENGKVITFKVILK